MTDSRIPVGQIDLLRYRMERPGAEPISQEEVLDALDAARYLLKLALPGLPADEGRGTVRAMIADLRDIADRIYGYVFDPEEE